MAPGILNTMVAHLWQYLRYRWNETNLLSAMITCDRLYQAYPVACSPILQPRQTDWAYQALYQTAWTSLELQHMHHHLKPLQKVMEGNAGRSFTETRKPNERNNTIKMVQTASVKSKYGLSWHIINVITDEGHLGKARLLDYLGWMNTKLLQTAPKSPWQPSQDGQWGCSGPGYRHWPTLWAWSPHTGWICHSQEVSKNKSWEEDCITTCPDGSRHAWTVISLDCHWNLEKWCSALSW